MAVRLERGAFLISIDLEMAWGGVHRKNAGEDYPHRQERELVSRLLGLFEAYGIRATWCAVGHLFLDQCGPFNGKKHPEIVRPSYSWYQGDWFDHDPCTDLDSNPMWYGNDILDLIRRCKSPQEIASHGFSHIIAGDPGCTVESFDSDLLACRGVADSFGIELRSFVFPRNSVGHLGVLAKHGFTNFRGSSAPVGTTVKGYPSSSRRFFSRLRGSRANSIRAVFPDRQQGMWNLPATYFYHPDSYRWRFIPFRLDVNRVKGQLADAVRQQSLVHLWFHPHNLLANPGKSLAGLRTICQQVARLREEGALDNPTMGELAESLQKSMHDSEFHDKS